MSKTSVEYYGVFVWFEDQINFWLRHPIFFVVSFALTFSAVAVMLYLLEKFRGQDEDSA